jgi:hypothetical protein
MKKKMVNFTQQSHLIVVKCPRKRNYFLKRERSFIALCIVSVLVRREIK